MGVSPSPGDRFATPQTTISFRGVTPAALGTVRVTGSRSGVHPGSLVADPDGVTIWKPRAPFIPEERVTVHSAVAVTGAGGDSFSFTVARIASHAPEVLPPSSGTGPRATVSRSAARSGAASPHVAPKCKAGLPSFRSEPSLSPPGDCVNQAAFKTAPGYLFVTPAGTGKRGNGAAILNNQGRLLWYDPVNAQFVHNLQRLTYKGQPVLAFYQGKSANGFGDGEYVMMNEHYQVIAYIRAGDGDEADLHELTITPQNTALIGAYVPVEMNLTAEGGTASQVVYNYVVQEIDVTTGNVLFSWDSLDHLPVTDSEFPVPAKGAAFDYFHGNSISLTSDGSLLISGRNVSALYEVNRTTGAVVWELGGKHSSFTLEPSGSQWFCYQHYSRQPKANVITVFDDGGTGPASCPNHASRALTLTLNTTSHTATISRNLRHNPALHAGFLGSDQTLPNGDSLVSWGNLADITEFNPARRSNFDMSLSGESYRAIRAPWTGTPDYPPAVAAHKARGNKVTVYASWNGDTQVTSWRILDGSSPSSLRRVGSPKRKTGFETQITVTTKATWVAARALSSSGKVLATSPAVRADHTPSGGGYYLGTQAGNVYNFDTPFHGSLAQSGQKPASPLVGTVVSPSGSGYYLPSSGGNVYFYGAKFYGSPAASGVKLSTPVVGMGAYQGTGYYLATSGGNLYNFGKAPFDGSPQSAGITLTAPVAGIAVDPEGGYWLVEQDGGVLNFGAPWFGSERGKSLPAPVVGIAAEPNGTGYLLVTANGNVYPFGRAPFHGSPANSVLHLASPVVGIATGQAGKAWPQPTGYYVASANGDVYNFGIALPGSPDGLALPSPIDGVGGR
ncbi:MAG: arylsulfotransferase family protein [Streptosporangiaceae bacterium]